MQFRIALVDPHALIPTIGDVRQMRIERSAEASDRGGQRILEVAVLPFAESMPRHLDVTAEMAFLRIEFRNLLAIFRRQQLFYHGAAIVAEVFR